MKVALSLALLLACRTAAPPVLPPPEGEATVLVPGYKGSFLAEANGDHAWLTPTAALSSGDRSLALPFEGQRGGQRFGPLHPDGPMTRLSVLFFGTDVYLGFLEWGKGALPGLQSFAYDWRADLPEAGKALCAFIDQLPATRVSLVVHSMGGLVALHCLRLGSPKVARVVFVGTPFSGAPIIFKDFVQGDSAGRNHALLSPDALFTFPAAWQLMPKVSDFLREPADVYTDSFWLDRGLGVFADPSLRADAAYRAELSRMLAARARHWQALEGFAPAVPSLVVIGQGHPTESGADLKDLSHPPRADGDGTVLATSARPAFAHQELISAAEHVKLLQDEAVQRAIAAFVRAR